jgi:hypothetical protein
MQPSPPPIPPAVPRSGPQISLFSIWSLALSLSSFFCIVFFGSIPGIILGHIALARINRSKGQLTGRGLAYGGLAAGYFCLMLSIAFYVFIFGFRSSSMNESLERYRGAESIDHLKQIAISIELYQEEHANEPPPDFRSLIPYLIDTNNYRVFTCSDSATPGAWSNIDSWTDYVLATNTVTNGSQAVRMYSKPGVFRKGGTVLYQNGDAAWLDKEEFERVIGK